MLISTPLNVYFLLWILNCSKGIIIIIAGSVKHMKGSSTDKSMQFVKVEYELYWVVYPYILVILQTSWKHLACKEQKHTDFPTPACPVIRRVELPNPSCICKSKDYNHSSRLWWKLKNTNDWNEWKLNHIETHAVKG